MIISAQQTAQNGQVVVALIDGNYATVKKFYREPDFIRSVLGLESFNSQQGNERIRICKSRAYELQI
ncbi:MAG: LexA family protein [Pyrinomonadaceae bacterium]